VVDDYCSNYQDLFKDVRNYECFKYLHLGMISQIPRKSLPEIAKGVGINSAQSLHHFMANALWSTEELRRKRLRITQEALQGEPITVIIDETGDRKKGKKTDYVARQYLGSIGKVDRGIVSVNAYGLWRHITFPLLFQVFKPKGTLKEGDKYKTKITIATEMITELVQLGFNIELVLADSLYGESSKFIEVLNQHQLFYIVAIRSNHGVWLPQGQRVRANKWCQFTRTFSDGNTETRWIREIVYGKRRQITYWQLTTDTENFPENSTSFIMTNLPGDLKRKLKDLKEKLGNLYGNRTWVEYGFRQGKQELGWTDYRLTGFPEIEKWWEIIFSAYLMVSLEALKLLRIQEAESEKTEQNSLLINEPGHQDWNPVKNWKNVLNNLRLLTQPLLIFHLIKPWLEVFPNLDLLLGFNALLGELSQFQFYFSSGSSSFFSTL
jgi:SRSO17 transposase